MNQKAIHVYRATPDAHTDTINSWIDEGYRIVSMVCLNAQHIIIVVEREKKKQAPHQNTPLS
jgi:hypothetical protein